MSKFKEEELLEFLKDMHHSWKCFNEIIESRFPDIYKESFKKHVKKTNQAYQQIKERIKTYAEHQELTASYIDIVLDLYEQIEQKRPEMTEEWIIEKACEASRFYSVSCKTVADSRNFIRSLVEEMPAKRATVSEEFVENWADKFDGFAQQSLIIDIDLIKQMLKEAGVEGIGETG